MVGTKLDKISSSAEKTELREKFREYSLKPAHLFNFVLTSAKTGEGLSDFYNLIRAKVDVDELNDLEFLNTLGVGDVNRQKCEKCEKWFDKRITRDDSEYCPTCCEKYLIPCAKKDCHKKVRPKEGFAVYCNECFENLPFCPGCVGEKCTKRIDKDKNETHCSEHAKRPTCWRTGCTNKVGSKYYHLTNDYDYNYGTESNAATVRDCKYCSWACFDAETHCCKRGNCYHRIYNFEDKCKCHSGISGLFHWGILKN